MAYFINDKCVGCTACETVCPVTAINGVKKEFYFIDPKVCIDCGACGRACPYDAIFDTYGNTAEKVRRTEWARPRGAGRDLQRLPLLRRHLPVRVPEHARQGQAVESVATPDQPQGVRLVLPVRGRLRQGRDRAAAA